MESIRSRIFPNSEKKTDHDYLNDFEDFFLMYLLFFFKIQLSPVLKKKKNQICQKDVKHLTMTLSAPKPNCAVNTH